MDQRNWVRPAKTASKPSSSKDVHSLGASLNRCMTVLGGHPAAHRSAPTIDIDLKAILVWFQDRYPGAMYSGCGGGYMIVASETPVPNSLRIKVRLPAC